MKGIAGFSMVGAMVHTANTTATLQGFCGDQCWVKAFGNHSHQKSQTLHHQASFWGDFSNKGFIQ